MELKEKTFRLLYANEHSDNQFIREKIKGN